MLKNRHYGTLVLNKREINERSPQLTQIAHEALLEPKVIKQKLNRAR